MNLLWAYFPQILQGLMTTVALVTLTIACGFLFSGVFTLMILSGVRLLAYFVRGMVFVVRGTPLLVQVFIIYYGTGQVEWLRESFLWWIFKDAFACALIALSLNTACYTTEIFVGAIRKLPKGEIEACQAFGMSRGLMLRRVVFPRALRQVLPAYSNEVIMIIKSSTLASTITILDLMGMTRQVISETYATMSFLMLAGLLYLILNGTAMLVFKRLELRVQVG